MRKMSVSPSSDAAVRSESQSAVCRHISRLQLCMRACMPVSWCYWVQSEPIRVEQRAMSGESRTIKVYGCRPWTMSVGSWLVHYARHNVEIARNTDGFHRD